MGRLVAEGNEDTQATHGGDVVYDAVDSVLLAVHLADGVTDVEADTVLLEMSNPELEQSAQDAGLQLKAAEARFDRGPPLQGISVVRFGAARCEAIGGDL